MSWRRANERWERLIEIVEAMGFVEAFRAAGTERTYRRGRDWYGVGSSYLTLSDGEARLRREISTWNWDAVPCNDAAWPHLLQGVEP